MSGQKDLMHLTWNKRSWAALSVGPPPVGGAPAQRAVAPEAQKKLFAFAQMCNRPFDMFFGKGGYLISEKIILYFFHVGQFFGESVLADQTHLRVLKVFTAVVKYSCESFHCYLLLQRCHPLFEVELQPLVGF